MDFQAEEERPLVIDASMLADEPPPPRPGRDFESGMSAAPKLSILLIAANCAVFVWMLATNAFEDFDSLVAAGALTRERVAAGDWWRLGSVTFLHAGSGHLAGNCVMLYVLGMAAEHGFGAFRYALLYWFAAICASLMSIAFQPGPSVGASGAIFGVAGALIVFFARHGKRFHLRDKRIGWVLAAWAVYTIATGMADPLIDNYAHLGGLLGGAALGAVLRPALGGNNNG